LIAHLQYGKYDLKIGSQGLELLTGHVRGAPDDWRKAVFVRHFSAAELLLFDSEWEFEWSGGSFPVEFRADGYNHFVCKKFPAHSHWSLTNETVSIHWGKYGNYELDIDPASKSASGGVSGNREDWRKARWIRHLELVQKTDCEHHH